MMPGYNLHLTAAKMFLNKSETPIDQNNFLIGNLLPDTVKEKSASHFRDPERYSKRIEYPELEPFLAKYGKFMCDDSVKGYLYHLYIDRVFFKDYIPKIVTFLDENGNEESERLKVTHAYLKRTREIFSIKEFFSESYYYGDFTKMNTYLVERYQIPFVLDTNVKNPGIEEVDYRDIEKVLDELRGYLHVPAEAVQELKVFEISHLLAFLEKAAEEWMENEKR